VARVLKKRGRPSFRVITTVLVTAGDEGIIAADRDASIAVWR